MTPQTGLHLDAAGSPWWWLLVAAAAVGLVVAGYRHLLRNDPSARRLMTLRLLAVGVVITALLKPSCVSQRAHSQRPAVAVLLDDSQSMGLPGSPSASRWQVVRDWWQSPSARTLRDRFDVAWYDLSGRPLQRDPLDHEPARESSDLATAAAVVSQRVRAAGAAAVLLISDGRDTSGVAGFTPLREATVAVHTLSVGVATASPGGGVDVRIVTAEAPTRVIVGNTAPVTLRIGKSRGPATTVTVTAQVSGRTLAAREVTLGEGPREEQATLDATLEQPGQYVLSVTALPVGGDAAPQDNATALRIRVDATPLRVLYLEGVLRPEHTFLDERLANDPDVDLITLVRSGVDPVGDAAAALLTDERLAAVDAVLLGDVDADLLTGGADERIRRWVEAGGGLLVLGGYVNLSPRGLPATALRDALPVELPTDGAGQLDEPFRFEPTREGLRHPILRLGGDDAADRAVWDDTPPLRGIVVTGAPKPAAQVLAVHPTGQLPVLAVQPYGKGQVVLLAADTTWRWSRQARLRGEPDIPYGRFWSQTVRFLAGRDADTTARTLTVGTDRAAYQRTDSVRIRATAAGDAAGTGAVTVTVRDAQGATAAVAAQPAALEPGVWTAVYQPTGGGAHTVEATLATAAGGATDQATFIVAGSALELSDPRPDAAMLRQVATLTGGRHARLDDADAVTKLIDAIPAEPRVRRELRAQGLWSSPLTLVAFVGLVSVEWLLRRRRRWA